MGPMKIYVGNVPPSARNADLKDLFEKFGRVLECDILKEFAFVHMEDSSDGKAAIAGLNDTLWKGSRLRVEVSTTRTKKGEPSERKLRYTSTYACFNHSTFQFTNTISIFACFWA